jgi:catechol 2,3-dioxygenase-like lactoylglutathione lyase family enzyme
VTSVHNVGVIVADLDAAIAFFAEVGLQVEGRAQIEDPSVDRAVGIDGVRCAVAILRTPDGHGRLELAQYLAPEATVAEPPTASTVGMHRVTFEVDDVDDTVARLGAHGAELVGDIVRYGDSYRLCFVRGPGGIFVGLCQRLG